jgi:probable rRNA maturation factor
VPPATVHLNAPGGHRLPRRLLERAVREALASEGAEEAEISVTFLDDEEIAELNRRFLGHEGPTDVISFALHDEGAPPLGDVYVGLEQARRQAAEGALPLDEELVRLAIHGTLHVLGHAHPEEPEARPGSEQYRRQEALVRAVLADRGPDAGRSHRSDERRGRP